MSERLKNKYWFSNEYVFFSVRSGTYRLRIAATRLP